MPPLALFAAICPIKGIGDMASDAFPPRGTLPLLSRRAGYSNDTAELARRHLGSRDYASVLSPEPGGVGAVSGCGDFGDAGARGRSGNSITHTLSGIPSARASYIIGGIAFSFSVGVDGWGGVEITKTSRSTPAAPAPDILPALSAALAITSSFHAVIAASSSRRPAAAGAQRASSLPAAAPVASSANWARSMLCRMAGTSCRVKISRKRSLAAFQSRRFSLGSRAPRTPPRFPAL